MIDLYLPIAVSITVAGVGLLSHPAVRVDRCDMLVSLTGGSGVRSAHRVGAWRNGDRSVGGVVADGVVGEFAVMGTVVDKLTDRNFDLVEQRLHLRGIARILVMGAMPRRCRHPTADEYTGLRPTDLKMAQEEQ